MTQFTEQEKALNVLQALLELKEDGPVSPALGICWNVEEKLLEQYADCDLVEYWETSRCTAFENWEDPSASGCDTFPIIGNYFTTSVGRMWVKSEYAAARWRLVDHLIEHYTSLAEEE